MRAGFVLFGLSLVGLSAFAEDSTKDSTDISADAPPMLRVHMHADGAIRDTLGTVAVKPTVDVNDEEMPCFKQVDYLRKHNDPIMAVDYLREIVTQGDILPQNRARAILELSDVLTADHQEAEALCWLKVWTQSFPNRPEYGAVAYRIGTLYSGMGLTGLARDAYYLTLAHTVNKADMKGDDDLKYYSRLTNATLWNLAANEYQSGQWARAADLFQRYGKEATGASDRSLEKATFLQADCYYQLKQGDRAIPLYEETLDKHPFNPLAPQARLRLYHLYVAANQPQKAKNELEALAWSVRTVWPKEEVYWQRQTAQLLLAINQKNSELLPPLVKKSAQLPPEGKTWQDAISHYDALVGFQSAKTRKIMDMSTDAKPIKHPAFSEENELLALSQNMNQVLPPAKTAP